MQLYGTGLYEPELERYRMWYMASEHEQNEPEYYMCYAESQDGIQWNRPMVSTVELPDYPVHNAVMLGGHGLCIIKDTGGVPAHGNQRSLWDAGCRSNFPNPDYR